MGYFSRTKKSCISVFYIRTKFQSSPYNNKHFRILGGTVPLNLLIRAMFATIVTKYVKMYISQYKYRLINPLLPSMAYMRKSAKN